MSMVCNMNDDTKLKIKVLMKCLLIMVFIFTVIFIVLKFHDESRKSYMSGEVTNKDYYSLLLKYEYNQGSKHGDDFKTALKAALKDGVVTNAEYQQVTHEHPGLVRLDSPEYIKLYESAKPKLLEIMKAS